MDDQVVSYDVNNYTLFSIKAWELSHGDIYNPVSVLNTCHYFLFLSVDHCQRQQPEENDAKWISNVIENGMIISGFTRIVGRIKYFQTWRN